jgi:hypothetical protein
LARALKAQLTQAHAHRVDVIAGHGACAEQGYLAALAFVADLDGLAPGFTLAGVDLAELEHLALRHAAVGRAAVLHHAPVFVGLAVLLAALAAQEHARHWTKQRRTPQRTQSLLQALWRARRSRIKHLRATGGPICNAAPVS